jgi:hypothetical protein
MEWTSSSEKAALEKKEKDARARLAGAVAALAKTEPGMELIRHLLAVSGALRSAFTTDTHMLAYREGARAVGLEIVSLCAEAGCLGHVVSSEEA